MHKFASPTIRLPLTTVYLLRAAGHWYVCRDTLDCVLLRDVLHHPVGVLAWLWRMG